MNYLLEIRAFYDWLESAPQVSTSSIVLWHALMHQANKTGWKDEFSVSISTLELRTGLKRGAIYNARSALRRFGAIEYRERHGNLSAVYQMKSLCLSYERKAQHTKGRKDEQADGLLHKVKDIEQKYIKNARTSAPVKEDVKKKNRFINYEQHTRDYDEIERMELLRIQKAVAEGDGKNDKGQA